MKKIVLGVLASTRGTDMQAIIDAIETKKLDAKIAAVISDKQDSGALERARNHKIDALFINPKEFASREEFDKRLIQELEARSVELVLLIGYMRFLSVPFIER